MGDWNFKHPEEMRRYKREYYHRNKKVLYRKSVKRRNELVKFVHDIKSSLKCECGESHPATLDFHHVDASKKDINISRALVRGWSKEHLLEEISKCRVICSNCHRKLHWNERNAGISVEFSKL